MYEALMTEEMKPWRDLLLVHKFAVEEIKTKLEKPSQVADFYKDVAVLAYPSLKGELLDSDNFMVASIPLSLKILSVNDALRIRLASALPWASII